MTDFIVLKQIDHDTTATSSISGLISLASYLFNNKSDELGWRFLNKAEQTAIDNEQHELLNNIYLLQLEHSESTFAPDVDSIYIKWETNKQLVLKQTNNNCDWNKSKLIILYILYNDNTYLTN